MRYLLIHYEYNSDTSQYRESFNISQSNVKCRCVSGTILKNGFCILYPKLFPCLFHLASKLFVSHIVWPKLSPPKHRNGQFYEILFHHIYEKLVCVGCHSPPTCMGLYFIFIFIWKILFFPMPILRFCKIGQNNYSQN